ncbi:alpha/beta-hydrolase [Pluteus cervinus]|uniref:Alpha/beta-hydrolase n=1 Tax=Pluteus cervinus TaxID=181527 RepID=A0ACD3AEL8_9AGAR|nr:alpha/beta-hydrolase [Pluteus cervinus]
MPTATIDDGSEIFFADTGPVIGSDNYTTLVIYHGTGCNGSIFSRLIPLAADSNVRLVVPNRRNYKGSSKFTETDLNNLYGGRPELLDQMATDVAGFLTWFLNNHDIPTASTDAKAGGLCVLSWSFGTATLLSFLGRPEVTGTRLHSLLAPFLRKVIIYDSPVHAFGWEIPTSGYSPFTDSSTEHPAEGGALYWSTHYTHGSIDNGEISALDTTSRFGVRSTLELISQADQETMFEGEAAKTDIGAIMYGDTRLSLREQTERALFEELTADSNFTNLRLVHLTCLASPWLCVWGFMKVRSRYQQLLAAGKALRPFQFTTLEDGNHFAHWEDPSRFWAKLVDILSD